MFFDQNDHELTGEIIGTPGSMDNAGAVISNAFDKDILTFFEGPYPSGSWVGLALEEASQVSKIRFMPRTDGNCIEPGDRYELVYWDNSWRTAGIQIAKTDSLIFKNVPSGALYLLHNRTKGKEERFFTYKDGEAKWW